MFEQPWFLLLLVPIILLGQPRRFFLRHSYIEVVRKKTWRTRSRYLIDFLNIFAITWLVVASANFYFAQQTKKKTLLSHNYVLINDASASMLETDKPRGIGKQLKSVIEGNKVFLSFLKNKEDVKDLVGSIVFSNDAYVVSYLVDDPSFVEKKLDAIDYTQPPLAGGTMIDRAAWSGITMILNKNLPRRDDFISLQMKFYGLGDKVKIDNEIQYFIDNKHKYAGSSLILFTDGIILYPGGAQNFMSVYKLFHFCELLGIRVYFLSVEQIPGFISKYAEATGGFAIILGNNLSKIKFIYEDIASEQANEYSIETKEIDTSTAEILAIGALFAMALSFILSNGYSRSFTEV